MKSDEERVQWTKDTFKAVTNELAKFLTQDGMGTWLKPEGDEAVSVFAPEASKEMWHSWHCLLNELEALTATDKVKMIMESVQGRCCIAEWTVIIRKESLNSSVICEYD